MLDEMPQENASRLAIFLENENPCSFFTFFISWYFIASLMNRKIEKIEKLIEKNKVARNEKWKKQLWVFVYIKYGKF